MRWKDAGDGAGWLERKLVGVDHRRDLTSEQAVAAIEHAQPFVYFIQAETGGLIKIGTAKSVKARLAGLQLGAPVRLKVLGVLRGSYDEERELHRRFAEHRRHGEWFEPCQLLLSLIDSITEPWDGA